LVTMATRSALRHGRRCQWSGDDWNECRRGAHHAWVYLVSECR
jgi:hypothetical protein